MTRNKAPKTAARQRMAQTGEPYSVARRATAAGHATAAGGPEPGWRSAGSEPGPLSPEER